LQRERCTATKVVESQMLIEYREDITSDFKGTIIDLETVGEFDNRYNDSRQYKGMKMVIFGYINRYGLNISCAQGMASLDELQQKEQELLDQLDRPFYAFNTDFERGVLFYELGREVYFDGELQEAREPKARAVRDLAIPNYGDPFYDNGLLCMIAWQNGDLDKAIAHNRACLLKERDILIRRGFRKPDGFKFIE